MSVAQVPEGEWADFAAGWKDLGATHLCVNTMGLDLGSPDDHVAALSRALTVLSP